MSTTMTEHHDATFQKIQQEAVIGAKLGLAILPLFAFDEGAIEQSRGKRPRLTDWQKRKLTPEEVADWWAKHPRSNIGIVTGEKSGFICLDIDPRGGGMEWAASHQAELAGISTAKEISGRGDGGFHLWMRHPGPGVVVRSGKIAPGVDLKADGGHQVVVAPSIHAVSGESYRWDGMVSDLSDLELYAPATPEWLLALSAALPAPKERRTLRGADLKDDPQDAEAFRGWLHDQPQLVRFQGANSRLYVLANMGCEYGLTAPVVFELLCEWNKNEEITSDEIKPIVRNAYRYGKNEAGGHSVRAFDTVPVEIVEPDPFQEMTPQDAAATEEKRAELIGESWHDDLAWKYTKNDDGSPGERICVIPTVGNAVIVLSHHPGTRGAFAFNDLTKAIEIIRPLPWSHAQTPRPIQDADLLECRTWLERIEKVGAVFEKSNVVDAIQQVAFRRVVHPIRQYLKALAWDGTPRIDSWLTSTYGVDDTPIHRAYARRTLIAAVARVMQPGCQVDTVLILEGEQGGHKTQGLKVLAAPWVKELHGDVTSKDFLLNMRGCWVVEIGELSAFNRTETNHLKGLISCRVDSIRDPYARYAQDVPRQCIWVGTTNCDHYLQDTTGNRRYWPVKVKQKGDLEWLSRNRDQLWAEAMAAYNNREQWWLTDAEEAISAAQVADRQIDEPLTQSVMRAVDGDDMNPRVDQISMDDLMTRLGLIAYGARSTHEARRVAEVLRKLGWVRKQKGAARIWVRA